MTHVNGELPAGITQEEWDQHSGELARVSGIVGGLADRLDRTNHNLSLVRGEIKALLPRLDNLDRRLRERDARLDRLDEWKEDTGRHELASLEKELAEQKAEEKKRFWFWMRIVGTVVGAVSEAAVLHFLHWGAP